MRAIVLAALMATPALADARTYSDCEAMRLAANVALRDLAHCARTAAGAQFRGSTWCESGAIAAQDVLEGGRAHVETYGHLYPDRQETAAEIRACEREMAMVLPYLKDEVARAVAGVAQQSPAAD